MHFFHSKKNRMFSILKDWPVSENLFWQLTSFVYQEYINELKI